MKKLIVIAGALALTSGAVAQDWKDLSLSPEERAAALVSQLSLEEKSTLVIDRSLAVERLGIPEYNWWNEALHGVARNGKATSFPMPIGMAASFDRELIEEAFTAASDEARIKHRQAVQAGAVKRYQGLTFWTPNINIFRDPRWGRGMETYGEDPYLTGQLGMAVVRGLQGDPGAPVLKAHACAKHFAVHSGPESERHRFDAEVSERDLRETYLPAFKDLVTKAGVQEVMTAYNRFRGVPCGASDYLINNILRGEWAYQGIITSDCGAIADFFRPGDHGYSEDAAEAAAAAIKAGVDTECGWVYKYCPEAVNRGLLDEADLDRNLIRLIAARIRLGELDGIDPWSELPDSLVECDAHRALAYRLACESMVLLQNRGGVLPLEKGERIALIGPNSDHARMQLGNYQGKPDKVVTLREALEELVPGLVSFPACGLMDSSLKPADWNEEYTFAESMSDEEILERLQDIDVVIFAGGISYKLEGEDLRVAIPGFYGGDRTDIELPAVQRHVLQLLHDSGKKVVFVNFSGSAIGLVPETGSCDAILQAWYPGQEGGVAIRDVLFGKVSPSGKLPLTFYRNVEQLPDFHDYNMAGHTYRYFGGDPLFPFGYGLSYSDIEYLKVKVRRGRLIVRLRNTGSRDVTETVQLYVSRPGDTDGPLKTLRDFKRVRVKAGRRARVRFPLTDETFIWWSPDASDMVPLPGSYLLQVGSDSSNGLVTDYNFAYFSPQYTRTEPNG